MNIKKSFGLALAVTVFTAYNGLAQSVVYSSTGQNPADYQFAQAPANAVTYGNWIHGLGSDERILTSFSFDYWLKSDSGAAKSVTLSLYNVDPINGPQGSAFFTETGSINPTMDLAGNSLSGSDIQNGRSSIEFYNLNVALPASGSFVWVVEFSGLSGSEKAGTMLTDKVAVGEVYNQIWSQDALGKWLVTMPDASQPLTTIVAHGVGVVPEPSSIALLALGGMACVFFIRRQTRTA